MKATYRELVYTATLAIRAEHEPNRYGYCCGEKYPCGPRREADAALDALDGRGIPATTDEGTDRR